MKPHLGCLAAALLVLAGCAGGGSSTSSSIQTVPVRVRILWPTPSRATSTLAEITLRNAGTAELVQQTSIERPNLNALSSYVNLTLPRNANFELSTDIYTAGNKVSSSITFLDSSAPSIPQVVVSLASQPTTLTILDGGQTAPNARALILQSTDAQGYNVPVPVDGNGLASVSWVSAVPSHLSVVGNGLRATATGILGGDVEVTAAVALDNGIISGHRTVSITSVDGTVVIQ